LLCNKPAFKNSENKRKSQTRRDLSEVWKEIRPGRNKENRAVVLNGPGAGREKIAPLVLIRQMGVMEPVLGHIFLGGIRGFKKTPRRRGMIPKRCAGLIGVIGPSPRKVRGG